MATLLRFLFLQAEGIEISNSKVHNEFVTIDFAPSPD